VIALILSHISKLAILIESTSYSSTNMKNLYSQTSSMSMILLSCITMPYNNFMEYLLLVNLASHLYSTHMILFVDSSQPKDYSLNSSQFL